MFSGKVLQATDRRKVTFLDVLIECDQKMVVSNAAVGNYVDSRTNSSITKLLLVLPPVLQSVFLQLWLPVLLRVLRPV